MAVLLAAAVIVLAAPPAAAHTALLGSVPSPGERLAYAPEEVVLTFADPVETATVSATLRSVDGTEYPLELATTAAESDVIVFAAPQLPRDVFGLSYESVGPDGHRVRGEVLFGVGTAPGDAEVAPAPRDAGAVAVDVVAAVVRAAWYAALAAAAAVVVLGRRAGPVVAGLARRRTSLVLGLLGATTLARGAAGVLTAASAGGSATRALTARPALTWGALALALAIAAGLTRRGGADRTAGDAHTADADRGRSRDRAGGRRPSPRSAVTALWTATIVGGVLAGHAVDRPDPVLAVAFGVIHLAAAALWVGPVLGLAAASRSAAYRDLGDAGRRAELRAAVGATAAVAGWALAAAVGSGGLLALRAWTGGGAGPGFTAALVAKAAVVALVALPLGVLHHRGRERWVALPGTVRVEVAALCAALVLGSALVAVDPGWGGAAGGADAAVAALLDGAEDPADCAQLEVGRASCYRTSLAAILSADGPEPAIDALERLSTTDDYVMQDCHQVAHDLGNDAARQIADMGQALAVEASVCWSGYYHGFVEARLAEVPDPDLAASLPTFCDGAAEVPYSFTHYNCLHGLGHGLMLRSEAALFDALPLCEEAGEAWEDRSCASGVFMENVMAAQQQEPATFDAADPLYPCTAVEGPVAEDCYLMQTSHILWANGGDIAGAFAECDRAPAPYDATCYRSMGRDISSRAALDAARVVELCEQGAVERVPWCYDGAAANAVYETADTTAADPLCALLEGASLTACEAAAAQSADTITRG